MIDDKPGIPDSGPVDEPQELDEPLEADEGIEEEELYDANGKPLPWANSKRFRKLYKDAKQGREVAGVLNEVGLSASELRTALGELGDYRAAYREWQASKDKGETTPSDDAAAAELKAKEREATKRLKELGFVTKEDIEAAKRAERQESTANQVASQGHRHLHALLTNEGIISDDMDDDDVEEIMVEWDAKVGRRLMKDRSDVRAYQSGDKKVITKHFKDALESSRKRGAVPAPKGSTKINNLPSRISVGATARPKGGKVDSEPESIREAAAQMFADMNRR